MSIFQDATSLLFNAVRGLPALIGVFLGFWIYPFFRSPLSFVILVSLLIFPIVVKNLAVLVFKKNIQLGQILLELWVIVLIPFMAISFILLIEISVNAHNWLPFVKSEENKGLINSLVSGLVGAVTVFLGTLWTKDMQDSGGFFSPEFAFKQEIAKLFPSLMSEDSTRKEYSAVYLNEVYNTSISGWSLASRIRRAGILEAYSRTLKSTN
jgi:hypothetical protein